MQREPLDHIGALNLAAKYLARRPDAPLSDYAEPWRIPTVDADRSFRLNRVTFVWRAESGDDNRTVSVVGSFDNLWDSTPLEPVVLVSQGQVHTYKFLVDGQPVLDPINPQRTVLDNGIEWSRFFTQGCATPVSFETWELAILTRLTNEILPFT